MRGGRGGTRGGSGPGSHGNRESGRPVRSARSRWVTPVLIGYDASMSRLSRYILRQLAPPTLFIAAALLGVVWLTQSLRFVDMIVNRGLSASQFLYFTVLLLPGVLAVILPVALLCGSCSPITG